MMNSFALRYEIFFLDPAEDDPAMILQDIASRWAGAQVIGRRLAIPMIGDVTQGDYIPEIRTTVFVAAFNAPQGLIAFMGREAPIFGAIGITMDAELSGPEATVYVASDADAVAAVQGSGARAYLAENGTVREADAMLADLAQIAAGAPQLREDAERAVHGAAGSVRRIMQPLVPLPGADVILLARDLDVLIGGQGSVNALAVAVMTAMGATAITHIWQGDQDWIGAEADVDGVQMELYPEDAAHWPGLPTVGALLRMTQTFDGQDAGTGPDAPLAFEDGLRRIAAAFGLCVVVDMPLDAASGRLSGFEAMPDGSLAAIDIALQG
jgi:hypothetical protein